MRKETSNSFMFNKEQSLAFEALFDKVCTPPVLSLPMRDFPYSVDSDAIRAFLRQMGGVPEFILNRFYELMLGYAREWFD